MLVFLLKPHEFLGERVLAPPEALSQYAVRHSSVHPTLKGPGRQTENVQEEITALQHYRCQSKVLALHVIKPATSLP